MRKKGGETDSDADGAIEAGLRQVVRYILALFSFYINRSISTIK